MKQFNKLQQKWGVGAVQFWLIMLTFAIGGSLSGYLNKQLLNLVFLEKNVAYWVFYPIVLTILWPFSVIFVSLVTGQFRFFKGYLSRMLARLFGKGVAKAETAAGAENESTHYNKITHNSVSRAAMPIHVAIFASGAGSNAKKIIEYFENQGVIKVSLIVCNVPGAGVLAIAAIIEAGEIESGITIHWVDAHYDEGDIIFQARCLVDAGETAETLANKIHALEHAHFAPTIEKILLG